MLAASLVSGNLLYSEVLDRSALFPVVTVDFDSFLIFTKRTALTGLTKSAFPIAVFFNVFQESDDYFSFT